MGLRSGMRLGPYEIVAPIGSGGMGEVYKATDTRLGRTVAIKILPSDLSRDAKLKIRLEREAKTISSLNHPHICSLYDVGEDYLVMEHCEGETLARRLERGALSIPEVLRYGRQIAEALEGAHARGVIHRDLKPANVMLTATGVKLLDFGIAKDLGLSLAPDVDTDDLHLVGTIRYMAPETLRTGRVDVRTDVFAFGLILFEMATGRAAFSGNQAELIAAILEHKPPAPRELRPAIPPSLDRLIQTCIATEPDARIQSVRDVSLQLRWIEEWHDYPKPASLELRSTGRRILLAALLAIALIPAALWIGRKTPEAPPHFRISSILLPDDASLPVGLGEGPNSIAVSSDETVAFATRGGPIYVRRAGESDARALAGTDGARQPFFSPDGRWLAFLSGGMLKRMPLEGGTPQTICNVRLLEGAAWTPDDTIIFSSLQNNGLHKVPAAGGTPVRLTTPREGEIHVWPSVLADGRHLLYTIKPRWSALDQGRIAVMEIPTASTKIIFTGGSQPVYTRNGHLLFARNTAEAGVAAVFAVAFDATKLRVLGNPRPVAGDVRSPWAFTNASWAAGGENVIAYAPHNPSENERELVWIDRRTGSTVLATTRVDNYSAARLAPDGKRVAYDAFNALWVGDLERNLWTRVESSGWGGNPIWSPDGRTIAYQWDTGGRFQIHLAPADGSAPPRRLDTGPFPARPTSFSPDGKTLAFVQEHPDTHFDLWMMDVETGRQWPFVVTQFFEDRAIFSPDGKWIAYVSSESGGRSVFVRPSDGREIRFAVSSGPAVAPKWSRTGQELLFRSGTKLMAVDVAGPDLRLGRPRVVLEADFEAYDLSADSTRILAVRWKKKPAWNHLNLATGWATAP